MPLPNQFSEFEHLQDQIRRVHNKEARDYFGDAPNEDVSTPRGSLKQACLIKDDDTAIMTLLRLWLFEFTIGRGRRLEIETAQEEGNLPPNAVMRRQKPIITLHFKEDLSDVEPGYEAIRSTIGFRLMNQSTTTISNAEANSYANKIKIAFGTGNGFVWRKGRTMCSYTDWDKGYQLQLLCRNEAEGRRVVEQVLDIQSDTPDWQFFQIKENAEPSQAYPTIPPRETILGKSQRTLRRRPVADVRYQYSTLKIAGVARRVVLHDRSYRFRNALAK